MNAVEEGDWTTVQRILDEDPDIYIDFIMSDGGTVLWHAAKHGQLEIVRLLLERGADKEF